MDPSPPGRTELSRLWLQLSRGGVPGIKWEGTRRGQSCPLGDWVLWKGRVPLPVHPLQPETREVLAAPARSAPSRARLPGAGPAAGATAAAAPALGCSRARERALWRGVGTGGKVVAWSLPETLPPQPPGATPTLASTSSAPPAPTEFSGKAGSGPPPGARAPRTPLRAQSARREGLLGKGLAAAVSGWLARGAGSIR